MSDSTSAGESKDSLVRLSTRRRSTSVRSLDRDLDEAGSGGRVLLDELSESFRDSTLDAKNEVEFLRRVFLVADASSGVDNREGMSFEARMSSEYVESPEGDVDVLTSCPSATRIGDDEENGTVEDLSSGFDNRFSEVEVVRDAGKESCVAEHALCDP